MTIRNRILLAFAFLSLVGLAAGVAGYLHLERNRAQLSETSQKLERYFKTVERAYELVFSINDKIFLDLFPPDSGKDYLPELERESMEFYKLTGEMDRLFPGRNSQHKQFREAFLSYYVFANRLIEKGRLHKVNSDGELLSLFKERKTLLSGQLVETLGELRAKYRQMSERAEELATRMAWLLFGVALLIVAASAGVAWMLSRSFARPMSRLLAEIDRFEADMGGEVKAHKTPSDEVESLLHAFERMRERLSVRERELLKRNLESVGRLAAGMAHEYNNLLGAVAACLHPLKAGGGGEEQVREEAERIALLCRRGGELSSQLLALAGKNGGQAEFVDTDAFCEHLKGLLPRLVPSRVSLRLEVGRGLPPVRCPSALLLSALLNLLYNAVDATPEGGRIIVSVESQSEGEGPSMVVFSVSDSGSGIPSQLTSVVFDPFFTTKAPGSGTGLGLSVVHAFAEHHGGSVEFSRKEGKTVFSLKVPEGKRPQPGTSVLVLTDRPKAARMAREILGAAGFSARCPSDSEEMFNAVRDFSAKVDLVLIDTELVSITPEGAYKLLKRFYPGTPLSFFGARSDVARSIDPSALWSESPDAGLLEHAFTGH